MHPDEDRSNATKDVVDRSVEAFNKWRIIPAPIRGEYVRRIGDTFREGKELIARQIVQDSRKIYPEALGEVQEVIDICDFAVGLSRQLHGLTIASERPSHRMMEQWHPLGPVGVISAFNFPMAVWAWNAMLAFVCGDSVIWKPSERSVGCAAVCHALCGEASVGLPVPKDLLQLMVGGADVGMELAKSPKVPLISATGSTLMGKAVGLAVGVRLGRAILELGGNNAMVVAPSADLDLAVRAIVFSAVGTCGQRCTTLRRLIVHSSIVDKVLDRLKSAYASLKIGDPMKSGTLVGPIIDESAAQMMDAAISKAQKQGGTLVFGGGRITKGVPKNGVYVWPAIVRTAGNIPVVKDETFAPILYVMQYRKIEDAIALNNGVPQGLSSAIFTTDIREAELFMSPAGSDCGIANVNIGTSGAEIGGAFGGEKDSGGGRESGSDSWKAYMRRTTNTINYSSDLPLAQGIKF